MDNNQSFRNNDDNKNGGVSLTAPCVQPGDAILSINGIPASYFQSTQLLANYIRQHCQQKMTIVIMRHDAVWKTTRAAMVREEQHNVEAALMVSTAGEGKVTQQHNPNYVANTIKKSWILINNNYKSNSQKSNVQSLRKVTKASSPSAKKKRKITAVQFDEFDNRQLYNPMFKDEHGNPILYCDNDDFELDDGKRIHMFLNDEIERDFNGWLCKRKTTWRQKWQKSIRRSASIEDSEERSTVAHDFWLFSDYESFDHWLSAAKTKWRRSYSWHVDRRNQLEEEYEKTVHLPFSPVLEDFVATEQFKDWLTVRKQQWKIARRKRQRKQQQQHTNVENLTASVSDSTSGVVERSSSKAAEASSIVIANKNDTIMYIDEMLEMQEEIETNSASQKRHTMDASWMFDAQLGAPDDIILLIMRFLQPFEHGNLLCLSYTSYTLFKLRESMWKSLCPKHWILPRRPRKSWCVLYITKIRAEEEAFRKSSDDLLVKANVIIEKGDLLNKLEKLVKKGEKDFRFDVNYTSGVVLERNSLLNMAIIDKRTKIAKWLMEQKNADIETWDRGQFTPLLNAAWNGDKHMVRYLLARGADRTKTGLNHSSKGLAPAGFMGLRAEEWARKRGHEDVAELIRIGI